MSDKSPTEQFITEIKKRLKTGVSFTPFLGSGISAQSGILMSQEFSDYLAYTVYKVIKFPAPRESCWNIRVQGWPALPDTDELDATYKYLAKIYGKLGASYNYYFSPSNASRHSKIEHVHARTPQGYQEHDPARDIHMLRPLVPEILRHDSLWENEEKLDRNRRNLEVQDVPSNSSNSATSLSFLEDKAIRALAHWTTSLEFLASVDVILTTDGREQPVVAEIDLTVIDNFNAHITKGKRPNLIHNMVSRLSRSLRTHLILTTNFDELIEASYRDQGEPLLSIPVSIKGGLPGFASVRAQDSLVKLHGDMQETRADSSINDRPTDKDKLSFYHYLRGPNPPNSEQPDDFCPSDLLVLGYSASDARCVEMIKAVLDYDDDFHVFWVCHTSGDVRKVTALFQEYIERASQKDPSGKLRQNQLHILETDRADLLLWELYQQVNLALPGGGSTVHFEHHVPPTSFKPALPATDAILDRYYNWLSMELKGNDQGGGLTNSERKAVYLDPPSGTAGNMANLYYAFQRKRYDALWLELEDYASPLDLMFQLLLTLSIKKGQFQKDWINLIPNMKMAETFGYLTADDISELEPQFGRDLAKAKGDANAIKRIHAEQEKFRTTKIKEIEDAWITRLSLIEQKFRLEPARTVIFLYGRNGLGGCVGWRFEYWDQAKERKLKSMISLLSKRGYSVIAMLNGDERIRSNTRKVDAIDGLIKNNFNKFEIDASYVKWSNEYYGCFASKHDQNTPINPVKLPESDTTIYEFAKHHFALDAESKTRYDSIMHSVLTSFFNMDAGGGVLGINRPFNVEKERMEWLYGLTLFRQSRHPAALISEAVFQCPFKFNKHGFDNDEIRYKIIFEGVATELDSEHDQECAAKQLFGYTSEHTSETERKSIIATRYSSTEIAVEREGWLNWLARMGLFLRKPGGYTWKYRDTRLGIQYLLERFSGARSHQDGTATLWKMRARMHYQIGDWYLRAFYATKHVVPLLEAMYHSVQALQLAPYYESRHPIPDKRKTQRALMFWAALCQLRRLVKIGKSTLLIWNPGLEIVKLYMDDKLVFDDSDGKGIDIKSIKAGKGVLGESVERLFPANAASDSLSESKNQEVFPEKLRQRIETDVIRVVGELNELRMACLAEGKVHGGNTLMHFKPRRSDSVSCEGTNHEITLLTIKQEILILTRKPNAGVFFKQSAQDWSLDILKQLANESFGTSQPRYTNGIHIKTIENAMPESMLQYLIHSIDCTESPLGHFNSVDAWAEWRQQWLCYHWAKESAQDGAIYKLLWLLHELMYRIIRRAKLEKIVWESMRENHSHLTTELKSVNAAVKTEPSKLLREDKKDLQKAIGVFEGTFLREGHQRDIDSRQNKLWLTVCAIGHTSLGLFRNLSSDNLVDGSMLRVKILNLYGTALGYLGRYTEANRRFNETHALVISALRITEGKELARVHIRRAEISVKRAFECMPTNVTSDDAKAPSWREFCARIDEVWASLERGEMCLNGASHSSFWWFRLLAVKLACYAAIAKARRNYPHKSDQRVKQPASGLPFRRRLHFPTQLLNLLRDGLLLGDGDQFRQFRVIDYALTADELCDCKVFGRFYSDDKFKCRGILARNEALINIIESLVPRLPVKPITRNSNPLDIYRFCLRERLIRTNYLPLHIR